MKENPRQHFRWAPHAIGMSIAKPKDYEVAFEVEAASPYALWLERKDTEQPLEIGDIVESGTGELRIYKYVGFEEVQWQLPEIKSPDSTSSEAAASTETATLTPPGN
jgi:hypothetical protein